MSIPRLAAIYKTHMSQKGRKANDRIKSLRKTVYAEQATEGQKDIVLTQPTPMPPFGERVVFIDVRRHTDPLTDIPKTTPTPGAGEGTSMSADINTNPKKSDIVLSEMLSFVQNDRFKSAAVLQQIILSGGTSLYDTFQMTCCYPREDCDKIAAQCKEQGKTMLQEIAKNLGAQNQEQGDPSNKPN
mmetsp:Transcript_6444/g.6996  ORF Transcript_6444/g.6996 Transcript_6444/m.6996 type:complete len:186 (+) Transcript_6444:18-575(+)